MPTKGAGPFQRLVTIANPAPGAEWTIRAPGEGIWRIVSLSALLTTSAAVANRRPGMVADDQTDTWFAAISTVDLVAATATRLGAYQGAIAAGVAGTLVTVPLPQDGMILMPGYRLRSSTLGIDVADQWSAVRAYVVEYPEGPDLEWLPSVFTQLGEMG